ncbi:MAG: methylmalonyl Co-A mutase-associated GTPase MeaB [Ktedonobacterales bacterium]|nr:methylmalonyl Co-A mutase-associated GTPase MeaB [Ktedonobacterales bacterium]
MYDDLITRLTAGDRRALARMVSLIENGAPGSQEALARLHALGGHAHIIGVTGSPGAGKSTLVMQLVRELRRRAARVAIIAVDPTSPFTGGAILGDRIRMQDIGGDPNVYIRSMASRGSVGGLSSATRDAVRVLDAAAFDHIIIETVGAGQAEVEIVRAAQSIVVVTVPGMGDDIQALKAGILEIADCFCVNKADRPGADGAVAELRMLLSLDTGRDKAAWKPPIVKTIAATGEGVPALADALANHIAFLRASGQLVERGERQARSEILALLYQALLARVDATIGPDRFAAVVREVAARENDPYSAARAMEQQLGL